MLCGGTLQNTALQVTSEKYVELQLIQKKEIKFFFCQRITEVSYVQINCIC